MRCLPLSKVFRPPPPHLHCQLLPTMVTRPSRRLSRGGGVAADAPALLVPREPSSGAAGGGGAVAVAHVGDNIHSPQKKFQMSVGPWEPCISVHRRFVSLQGRVLQDAVRSVYCLHTNVLKPFFRLLPDGQRVRNFIRRHREKSRKNKAQ